jgi:hypothetical protein
MSASGKNLPPNPVNDTSQLTEDDWGILRESVARLWATLEHQHRQGRRAEIDVIACMATVLEGYRHEQGFLNAISARVNELLEEAVLG